MTRPTFSTSEFQFSHGKQPRGEGYWAFFFDRDSEPQFWSGSYAEAKRQATAYAKANGKSFVRVGP
jgi:hypothetical protein